MDFYTDIHCHILPGADDGAKDMEESVAMLRTAYAEGIRRIILTPHQKPEKRCISANGIRRRMEQLRKEISGLLPEMELYAGSELFYSHDLGERLDAGQVLTLADSHYVLVEFMPAEDWRYLRDGLCSLCRSGYWPVLAHAERYTALFEKQERIQELIDMGCYMQMNAGSLMGAAGLQTKLRCAGLIRKHQIHFVATDAHESRGRRSPQLRKCAEWIRRKSGGEYAEQLLFRNAEHIFQDTEL